MWKRRCACSGAEPGGALDALFAGSDPPPARLDFDLARAGLRADGSFWSHAGATYRLGDCCDGWIFKMPIANCEGCTPIEDWFDEGNRREALAMIANPEPQVKDTSRSVESLRQVMSSGDRFERVFGHLRWGPLVGSRPLPVRSATIGPIPLSRRRISARSFDAGTNSHVRR